MKKILLGTILLALVIVVPVPTMAGVNISVGISLPPVVFNAPPNVVVMPDTYDVYVAPDIDVDLFFWNGWWWRPWEGRWYRSHYYDRGWAYYNQVPSFYFDVDPGWRRYYRNHNWYGHPWHYKRIPHQELQRNWNNWNNNHYWEKQRTWDVQKYHPRPQQEREELRHQRQEHYQRGSGEKQQEHPHSRDQKNQEGSHH